MIAQFAALIAVGIALLLPFHLFASYPTKKEEFQDETLQ